MHQAYLRLYKGLKVPGGKIGPYDVQVLMAHQFNWPDFITNACDPDFITQLEQSIKARNQLQDGKSKGTGRGKGSKRGGSGRVRVVAREDTADLDESTGLDDADQRDGEPGLITEVAELDDPEMWEQ